MPKDVKLVALTSASLADQVDEQFSEIVAEFLNKVEEQRDAARSGFLKYKADKGIMSLKINISAEIALHVENETASLNVSCDGKQPARAPKGRMLMAGDGLYLVPQDHGQEPLPFPRAQED
jgi:hypothetical protein